MSLKDVLEILAIPVLVMANAFFVAAEFALVSVRRTRIAELAAHGQPGASATQKALEHPDRVIAATQLGITMASLGLGWVGEPALAHLFEPLIGLLPVTIQSGISHSFGAVLSFIIITFITVVAGELAPKSIALQNPEKTALLVAGPTLWTERLFKPVIWLLNGVGNRLLKLIGIKPAEGQELVHSVAELKMLVTASAKEGVVEADEREMLHAVFDFGELLVRQVMVPRTEVVAVEATAHLAEIITLATQSTFTKFPVYEENLDQIVGIVHVQDLLKEMQKMDYQNCTARDLAREPLFVPEVLPVSDLLRRFRDQRQHVAIAMDEFGGTSGIVTLQDLLEEIVGEVKDPFDQARPEFQALPDGSILVDGLTLIEEVNEELGLHLHDDDYDTIAGYALGKFGHIPQVHDTVEGDGVQLQAAEMDGMRIARVAVKVLVSGGAGGKEGEGTEELGGRVAGEQGSVGEV
jgi:CBS domain containing-hemolysin-like protein